MGLTYAQFKRLKPVYKRRIIMVGIIGFALFVLLLLGISRLISFVQLQMNTTRLQDTTAASVLQKDTMLEFRRVLFRSQEIIRIIGQDNASKLLTLDSTMTVQDNGTSSGIVTNLTIHMVNLVSNNQAEYWTVTANEKRATLQKTETRRENMTALSMRKVPFNSYFPALSRVTSAMPFLLENAPVGENGLYHFVDDFDNNQDPAYERFVTEDTPLVLVSSLGAVSKIANEFSLYNRYAPTKVSVQEVNEDRSTTKKTVLEEEAFRFVMMFEVGNFL